MRALGVGLVYWAALDPLFEAGAAGLSALELEPESLWEQVADRAGRWHYRCNEALLERVAGLPQHKLMHGVGHPIGGSVADPLDPWPLLKRMSATLRPAWVSEHLSFNRVVRGDAIEHAGFLLPPPQTPAGVRVAASQLVRYGQALGRPAAFETGVNYLRPRDGEIDDGDYFAAVARASGGGIVLDLHNLWCNERNGRQPVAEVLARLPLDRVWEIHLAGGAQQAGYWLDAHDGAVPPALLDIAAELVPRLPHLGAVVFEILPEHLPRIGLDGVQRELEQLQRLWALRRPPTLRVATHEPARWAPASPGDHAAVARWESTLANALRGIATAPGEAADQAHGAARGPAGNAIRAPVQHPAQDPAHDPGCRLLRDLANDFRHANLARALRYTMTCLLAGLGAREVEALLQAYSRAQPPEPFAAIEAIHFSDHLADHLAARPELAARVPFLGDLLAFERALLGAAVQGLSYEVGWSVDPTALIESLDAGVLPRALPAVHSRMRIEGTRSDAAEPLRA